MNEGEIPKLPELPDLWQETLAWQPDAVQQDQFQRFYELILAANRQFNLTRITEPSDFWEKHLWDSLRGIVQPSDLFTLPALTASEAYQVIDIGTGAGFPGVPIAIARPNWTVTLLDSTRKKISFLQDSVAALGLQNVRFWVDRAEQIGQQRQHREQYDLALIRAVATASVCAEYTLPLLKTGGCAVLYRGQWTQQEAEDLTSVVQQLGGTIALSEAFATPISQSVRHCLYLRKIAPTPAAFPRPIGIPTQTPL